MMFGWDAFMRIQEAQRLNNPEASKRQEVEDHINQEGRAVCEFCNEEILRNDKMPGSGWTWESEFLVGFCDNTKTRKHKPLVVYKKDGLL